MAEGRMLCGMKGFPIRTPLHIIVHLYNPVDSMCAGEMHFQVGRKVPGTVTLKFTKQNIAGLYVIQPKTLSLNDEIQLNSDPMELMNKIRLEMKDSCKDTTSLMQTLVLMTDTCKLERVSFKTVFGDAQVLQSAPYQQMQNIPPDSLSMYPQKSIPFVTNDANWGMCSQAPHPLDSMIAMAGQLDKPFQVPWNLCVKNYVNYNGQDKKSEVVINGVTRGSDMVQSDSRSDHHLQMGTVYRQARSTTWHSEPEENDETMDFRSSNEDCCGGSKGSLSNADIDDVEAKMANASLWTPPPKSANNITNPATLQIPGTIRRHSTETVETGACKWPMQVTNQNARSLESREEPLETRTSLTDEYAGNQSTHMSALQRSASGTVMDPCYRPPPGELRRYSEPRTKATEEYFSEARQAAAPSGSRCNDGRQSYTPNQPFLERGIARDSGVETQNPFSNKNFFVPNNYLVMPGPGTATNSQPPRSMTKTETVDEYAGANAENRISNGFTHAELDESLVQNYANFEGRRTSSLDAYVGSNDQSISSERIVNATKSDEFVPQMHQVNECLNNQRQGDNVSVFRGNYSQPGSLESTAGCSLLSSTPFNVPDISLLHNYPPNSASVGSIPFENTDRMASWASHAPMSRFSFDGNPDRRRSHPNMPPCSNNASLLTQDSFASWRSHLAGETPQMNLLPATIEEINHNVQIWQKSVRPNT